jgi:HEPN domain-containing protein
MITLDELKANAQEYLEDADYLYNKGHYNSALNLYFKALVAICDYIILRDTGKLPRNHSERFRILEERYPNIYDIVDFHFNNYRKTYLMRATKEWVEVLKNDVHNLYSQL